MKALCFAYTWHAGTTHWTLTPGRVRQPPHSGRVLSAEETVLRGWLGQEQALGTAVRTRSVVQHKRCHGWWHRRFAVTEERSCRANACRTRATPPHGLHLDADDAGLWQYTNPDTVRAATAQHVRVARHTHRPRPVNSTCHSTHCRCMFGPPCRVDDTPCTIYPLPRCPTLQLVAVDNLSLLFCIIHPFQTSVRL